MKSETEQRNAPKGLRSQSPLLKSNVETGFER